MALSKQRIKRYAKRSKQKLEKSSLLSKQKYDKNFLDSFVIIKSTIKRTQTPIRWDQNQFLVKILEFKENHEFIEALDHIHKLESTTEKDDEVCMGYAEVYESLGLFSISLGYVDLLLQVYSDDPVLILKKVRLLLKHKDYSLSLSQIEDSIPRILDSHFLNLLLLTKGEIYFAQKRFADSLQVWKQVEISKFDHFALDLNLCHFHLLYGNNLVKGSEYFSKILDKIVNTGLKIDDSFYLVKYEQCCAFINKQEIQKPVSSRKEVQVRSHAMLEGSSFRKSVFKVRKYDDFQISKEKQEFYLETENKHPLVRLFFRGFKRECSVNYAFAKDVLNPAKEIDFNAPTFTFCSTLVNLIPVVGTHISKSSKFYFNKRMRAFYVNKAYHMTSFAPLTSEFDAKITSIVHDLVKKKHFVNMVENACERLQKTDLEKLKRLWDRFFSLTSFEKGPELLGKCLAKVLIETFLTKENQLISSKVTMVDFLFMNIQMLDYQKSIPPRKVLAKDSLRFFYCGLMEMSTFLVGVSKKVVSKQQSVKSDSVMLRHRQQLENGHSGYIFQQASGVVHFFGDQDLTIQLVNTAFADSLEQDTHMGSSLAFFINNLKKYHIGRRKFIKRLSKIWKKENLETSKDVLSIMSDRDRDYAYRSGAFFAYNFLNLIIFLPMKCKSREEHIKKCILLVSFPSK